MKNNRQLAKVFEKMANLYELEGVEWKPRAYREAARGLRSAGADVEDIYREDGLKGLTDIPGVGESIAGHIEEYLKNDSIENYVELQKKYPENIHELLEIEGLGPKRVKDLVDKLGIRTVDELEDAVKDHKVRQLSGFGEAIEEDIVDAIKRSRKQGDRYLISAILPAAEEVVDYLRQEAGADFAEYAGSLRRMKETIGDIDIVAAADDAQAVIDKFAQMPGIRKVISAGDKRSTVILDEESIHVDLRVVQSGQVGAAMMYFTGSREHQVELRDMAKDKNWKLNEYGLFDQVEKKLAGRSEEEIYGQFGLDYIPPELREKRGEIEAAAEGKLPDLVEIGDIQGDLHIHSNWSEGQNSLADMLLALQQKGYKYCAVTDHSKSARIANGLDEERLREQLAEIDKIRGDYYLHIFKGSEVDIMADGSLDFDDDMLKELDLVIASVHSRLDMEEDEMTERLLKAIENKHVNLLGHPTGRKLGRRDGYDFDVERVAKAAAKYGVALEINSQPNRLDLNDTLILAAKEYGVKFAVDTDSHAIKHLDFLRYGVGQARRGWLTKDDIINCLSLEDFKKFISKKS